MRRNPDSGSLSQESSDLKINIEPTRSVVVPIPVVIKPSLVPRAPGPLPEQVEFDCRWEQKVDRLEQDLSPVAIEANTDPLRSMDPVFEPLSLARGSQAEVFSPTEADAKLVSNKDAIRILTDPSGPMVIPRSPSPHIGSGRIPNSAQTPPLSGAVRSADRDHSGLEADRCGR